MGKHADAREHVGVGCTAPLRPTGRASGSPGSARYLGLSFQWLVTREDTRIVTRDR